MGRSGPPWYRAADLLRGCRTAHTFGPVEKKCRKLGALPEDAECFAENACSAGLFCMPHRSRRAARDAGGTGGTASGEAGLDTKPGSVGTAEPGADGTGGTNGGEPEKAADMPWGYCCEGKGVCRQAEGCTSSKNQCLAGCPGVRRPGIGVEADLSAGVKADCARRMCNKNGAAAKMVADSNGDCQCPAFITDITGDAAAKEGEECTGSLQSSSGGMKSLKSASMTSSICSGMVCQLESEEGGDIVLMVADDEGACSCPGREDKNARQQAKLCGKGLVCAAAGKPWGYCCEGEGVCRQAEGCTSSKNQCLAACPGVKRPGIAIGFSRTCRLESWSGTSLEDGDCKTDEDCEAHSKCIIAPATGHEVVGGVGKCFNKPGEATDGPGMCTDLCDLMYGRKSPSSLPALTPGHPNCRAVRSRYSSFSFQQRGP